MPIENFGRATWPRPVEADRTGGGVSATPYWAPREEDDLKAAEAQWRQALQRLPDADRVEVEFLAMPQLAVMMDDAAENSRLRLLDRL